MIENQSNTEPNNEQHQDYDYSIDTATIFWNESRFRKDPEFFNCKKCPDEIALDLEHTIQELLVKYVEPTVYYSDDSREYLITRFEKCGDGRDGNIATQGLCKAFADGESQACATESSSDGCVGLGEWAEEAAA